MQLEQLEPREAPAGLSPTDLASAAVTLQSSFVQFSAAAQSAIQLEGQVWQAIQTSNQVSPADKLSLAASWLNVQKSQALLAASDQLFVGFVQNMGNLTPQALNAYQAADNLLLNLAGISH